MKSLLWLFALIVLSVSVSAQVWVSPAAPTINGNNYVFVAVNTTVNTSVSLNISDEGGVLKRECNLTSNEFGYALCRYSFDASDNEGEWSYVISNGLSDNFSVAKIKANVSTSVSTLQYGNRANLELRITHNGSVMEKPIVPRGVSRDLGTHAGKNDFVDLDGDGDLEIVIVDYNGRIWVWENISRFYSEGQMLITGYEWRTNDLGTEYLFDGCDYGDFDSDGKMTIICSEYSHAELFALVDKHPSATRDVNPDFTTPDQGDSIRTEPIICDVTGDGVPDQVAVNIYQGFMEVWDFSDTTGFHLNYKSADLGTGHYGTRALCDDFDGDGLNEWMLCIYDRGCYFADVTDVGGTNQVVLGDQQPDHGSYYSHGGTGDFDGDGVVDYAISNTNGHVELYHYDNSTSTIEETIPYNSGTDVGSYAYGGSAINVGDYNLNGKPDLIVTDTGTQAWFYELNSDNTGWNQTEIHQGTENTYVENAFVDFDGDGIKEVMFFGRYSGNVYVARFNGVDWDIIYEGWDHDLGEYASQGDGVLYGSNLNTWLYGLQCGQGDIDGDGLGEAVCMTYTGRGIYYEQAERYEENVSPELEVSVDTNGIYALDPNIELSDLRIHDDKTLALFDNVASGITDVVDEDNQNQGGISTKWTDGVIGHPTPVTYAQLDSSGTEEAIYSRIKLGSNYSIGGLRTWGYFADGRGTKNVIIRSTTDSSGNLCDFTTNDLLFDNSADGMNERYQEDSQGKMVYFNPVNMSCLRESSSGYSGWTTSSSNSNYRVELELYEASNYVPISVFMDNEDDSSYSVGDNVTVHVSAKDFTGNLINVVAQNVSMEVVGETTCPLTFAEIRILNGAENALEIT